MAKKATAPVPSYFSSPCDRCGSPKIIGKVWKETIETFNGKSSIEHTQIVCSDKSCQKDYDKKLEEEAKKKEALKAGSLDQAISKKAIFIQAAKGRAAKAKI